MARTAKKRIAIRDEGATLVADIDSIDFAGAGVSGAAVGNDVTETIPGGGGATMEIPTGAVDGVNTTFTVLNTPQYIVVDGIVRRSTKGYTYSAGTITVDPLTPPVYDIFSFY